MRPVTQQKGFKGSGRKKADRELITNPICFFEFKIDPVHDKSYASAHTPNILPMIGICECASRYPRNPQVVLMLMPHHHIVGEAFLLFVSMPSIFVLGCIVRQRWI